jgi:hypothetical protein
MQWAISSIFYDVVVEAHGGVGCGGFCIVKVRRRLGIGHQVLYEFYFRVSGFLSALMETLTEWSIRSV